MGTDLVLTLIVVAVAVGWLVASLNNRLESLEERVSRLERFLKDHAG